MVSYLKKAFATLPVIPVGVSGRSWAVAYVYIGASPNYHWLEYTPCLEFCQTLLVKSDCNTMSILLEFH